MSFGTDFARNIVILCVDNSSSSHANNRKSNLLVLAEGQTYGINGSFVSPEKSLVLILVKQTQICTGINFSKANTNLCLSLHCNADNSYFLMEKICLTLKPTIKMLTLVLNFVSHI